MATMELRQGVATVTMNNGAVVPVPPGYISMELGAGGTAEGVAYPGEDCLLWFTEYQMPCELDRDLADGECFTDKTGSTWTRYGDEMVVSDLGSTFKRAA